jgi:hypothetical protein
MNSAFVTSESVFCTGDRQLVQRFRRPDIAHHFEFSAGSVAEDSGKIGTALRYGLSKKQKSILWTVE